MAYKLTQLNWRKYVHGYITSFLIAGSQTLSILATTEYITKESYWIPVLSYLAFCGAGIYLTYRMPWRHIISDKWPLILFLAICASIPSSQIFVVRHTASNPWNLEVWIQCWMAIGVIIGVLFTFAAYKRNNAKIQGVSATIFNGISGTRLLITSVTTPKGTRCLNICSNI